MIRINLLPTKAAQKKESVIAQLVLGAVVIVVAVSACFFLNQTQERKLEAKRAEVKDIENAINQLKSVIKQVDSFEATQKELERKVATIDQLKRQRSGPVRFMEEFTYVLPRKAWVSVFREVGKQLTLEGLAVDGQTVADLVDSLRSSQYFSGVQLVQVQQADEAGRSAQRFNINCRVNYTPAGRS